MSNHESPNSGYIVPANKLINLLRIEHVAKFQELIEDGEYESAIDYFKANSTFPPPIDMFILDDEDTGDENMEHGVVYAEFPEDLLYDKKLSFTGKNMKNMGVEPVHCDWTKYG